MIRDLILSTAILASLALTLRAPFAGVLAWAWIALMQPFIEVYGVISTSLRLNLMVAVVTLLAWIFSKERKSPPVDGTLIVVALLMLWMTFDSFFALYPGMSWFYWDRTWRILALAVLAGAIAVNKVRIHALIWVVALSFGYYGIKHGMLTVLSGGAKKISGEGGTLIGDNNQLALTMLMILPLMNYLRLQSENRFARYGLIAGAVLTMLAALASYSRGAFIAFGALCLVGWWRSRNKLIFPFTVGPIVAAAFFLMPQAYYDRLATMNSLDTDGSFQGRLQAWHVAWEVAKNHFPFGAGFYGATMPDVFGKYFAGEYHAAHSIYFQILGDHGFIGLAIYLAVLLMGFVNAQRIRRATRNQPEFRWMYDLATMIQLSLVAFCVGGAGLSMAYDDITFLLIMLLSTMWAMLPKKRPYRSRSTQTGAAHVRPEPRPAYVAAEGRMPRLNPGQ